MPSNPYKVGRYVTGVEFYGRQDIINNLLNAAEDNFWIIGTRRAGKTSLLKQICLIAEFPWLPVYFSLEGIRSPREVAEVFCYELNSTLLRQGPQFQLEDVERQDFFRALATLEKNARSERLKPLLLMDEADHLFHIIHGANGDAAFLSKFRRFLAGTSSLRIVLTSSPKLFELFQDQLSFLQSFARSRLPVLEDRAAKSLIRQAQRPNPVKTSDVTVDLIIEKTGRHPYLIQYMCSKMYQNAHNQLKHPSKTDIQIDNILGTIFFNNLEFMNSSQVDLMFRLLEVGALPVSQISDQFVSWNDLEEMLQLGYLKQKAESILINNELLALWLRQSAGKLKGNQRTPNTNVIPQKPRQPVKGIPAGLMKPLRDTLLLCDEMLDPSAVRNLMTHEYLTPWRFSLPVMGSPQAQVSAVLNHLADQYRASGENALVLFLEVLAEAHTGAQVGEKLLNLAEQLDQVK